MHVRRLAVGGAGLRGALLNRAQESGLDDRFELTGPLSGGGLDAAYAEADVLVLASRAETYGMVITEALARGVPVIAADVGGVPEALGFAADGTRPGMLVPAGDVAEFAAAVRLWLTDADLRGVLRAAALQRRAGLRTGRRPPTASVASSWGWRHEAACLDPRFWCAGAGSWAPWCWARWSGRPVPDPS